ncbi:hypothetical protein NP233_g173 [Leucocoprinus birnbaumii]|uniref:Aminoglycoside phosphotransferase domain-containing protein n=1 Tax=Leucocoprinus birnbaumii TaxID=56174 RepID=A0AAD5W5X2_9AGAR|nr:hypothetical protein NP233_g173 [Leucocoprinus birnbaumii]
MDSDDPWEGVSIDLDALQDIVAQVFHYARVCSFQLPSLTVVARLVSTIKYLLKMEVEVAAMDLVRRCTSLLVQKVFAYCSEANNPVGMEWIIMERMPSVEMSEAWSSLQLPQKRKLALDLITLYDELFRLRADGCGSIYYRFDSVDDSDLLTNSKPEIKHSRSRRSAQLSRESLADQSNFRFSHGDLHAGNIFIDPCTGSITGTTDWGAAAFRPLWTDVGGVGWFDLDMEKMALEKARQMKIGILLKRA